MAAAGADHHYSWFARGERGIEKVVPFGVQNRVAKAFGKPWAPSRGGVDSPRLCQTDSAHPRSLRGAAPLVLDAFVPRLPLWASLASGSRVLGGRRSWEEWGLWVLRGRGVLEVVAVGGAAVVRARGNP